MKSHPRVPSSRGCLHGTLGNTLEIANQSRDQRPTRQTHPNAFQMAPATSTGKLEDTTMTDAPETPSFRSRGDRPRRDGSRSVERSCHQDGLERRPAADDADREGRRAVRRGGARRQRAVRSDLAAPGRADAQEPRRQRRDGRLQARVFSRRAGGPARGAEARIQSARHAGDDAPLRADDADQRSLAQSSSTSTAPATASARAGGRTARSAARCS